MNELFNLKRDSECEKDAKKRHFWEKLGVVLLHDSPHLIWRCTQCRKIIWEQLESLTLKEDG